MAEPTNKGLFDDYKADPVEVGESTGGSLFAAYQTKAFDIDKALERKGRNIEGTLLSKTGLDAESTLGGIVNAGATFLAGGSRFIGNIATSPIDAASYEAQLQVDNEAINAYSRKRAGEEALPGDAELLAASPEFVTDGNTQSNEQRLKSAEGLRDVATTVDKFFNIDSIKDTTQTDKLSDGIADNTAPGIAKLRAAADQYNAGKTMDAIKTGGAGAFEVLGNAIRAGLQNPQGVAEYAAENIPQLAAAAFSGGLSLVGNVGYGLDAGREGLVEFQRDNEGALPTDAERLKMGLFAASAAAAEQVGDIGAVKGILGAGAKSGIVKSVTELGKAAAREGVTEGYQTYAEQQAKLKDASIEEIVEGATIGAFVGGTYQGAAEIAKPARNAADKVATNKAVNAAAEAGDVETLAKMGTPTYDPVRAVQVLHREALKDPAKAAESVKRADAIQKDLTEELSAFQERAELFTPENKAGLDRAVETRTAELAAAPADDKAAIRNTLKNLTDLQKSFEQYTPEVAKTEAAQLKELTAKLDATRTAAQQMQIDATPDAPVLEEMQVNANSADPAVASQAASNILTLTMTNPAAFDSASIEAIASNVANGLSEQQRVALRTYSASQQAANELKGLGGVRSDIIEGGDGFKGINQYRDSLRLALADGNTEAAQAQVDGLASFAASRASKAAAITQAYEAVKGTDAKVQLVRGQDGVWTQAPQQMSPRQLKSAGGVEVSAKSFKLRNAVQAEAKTLAATAEAFGALVQAAPTPVQTNDPAPVDVSSNSDTDSVVPTAVRSPQEESVPAVDPVATEATVESEAASAPVQAGLTALQNKPEGEVTAANYQDTNLVAAYFEQSAGKPDAKTKKPLASTDDFMTRLRAQEVKISDFVKQDGDFTPAQTRAVSAFGKFQRWSAPFITAGFKKNPGKGTERFRFKDYAQFFINEDGSLDENVQTAVSVAMFNWANDNATKLTNDIGGINTILGKDKDATVSNDAYEALVEIGIRESAAAASIGADVVAALGLKLNPSAPANEQARLEASIGVQVIGALVRSGMAERTQITDTKLQTLMNSKVAPDPKVKHTFIRVKTRRVDGKLVANPDVAGVRAANVGAQSIIAKLFGSDLKAVEPSYTPLDFTQAKAKRTNQDVPPVLAERLNKETKKPHTVRQDVWHVWNNVSGDFLYKVGGLIDINDTPTHVENIASRTAKNDGLVAQVDNARAFISQMEQDKGLDQELFFDRSVWKPQRVGLTATVLNPQTSKAARSILSMQGWETNLDLNNPVMMDGFKLRILEAFDTKTENGTTANVLAGYDKVVTKPEIVAAVNQLALILRDEHIGVDEEVLLAGVQAGGAGFHSLDGLIALATVQNAQAKGETKVKVTLTGEVDGVTNGPMLSLLMLGAKDFDTMSQGGFLPVSEQYTQLNDYKAAGNLDLYQSTIAGALALLPAGDSRLAALQEITGTLQDDLGNVTSKARNIIKQPLTAMMFGSNTATATLDMADGFVDTIYTNIEKLAAAKDEAGLVKLLTAVNTTIGKAGLGVNTGMGLDQAMEFKLSTAQKNALKDTFMDLLGKPVEASLQDNYELFLNRRDTVNDTAQLAFDLYIAAKDALTEVEVANSTEIARDGKGNALTALTRTQEQAIEKRLKSMEPVLQTALSLESDSLSSGMHMSKTKRELDASQQYVSEVFLGGAVNTIQPDGSTATPQRADVSGMRTNQISPGVAPFITSIHSTDSAIASGSYTQLNALNVHDALIVALGEVEKVGKALNKQTFDTMLAYSAPSEMVNTLDRTLAGLPALLADPEVAPVLQAKLKTLLADRAKKKRPSIETQLLAIQHVAASADTDKLTLLSQMRAVSQYATDGGSYIVTDKDRTAALEKLATVGQYKPETQDVASSIDDLVNAAPLVAKASPRVPLSNDSVQTRAPATTLNVLDRAKKSAKPELAQAIATVQEAMVNNNIPLVSAKTAVTPELAAEVVNAANAATTGRTSVWGEIGVPVVSSNPDLVRFLEQSNNLTAHQLIDMLAGYANDLFTKNLLGRVKAATRQNVKVNYITAQTGPEGAVGTSVDKSRGWYSQHDSTETLNIKSPEFVESGVTEELLVHELLHAALATTIERAQNGGQSEAKDLVNDLEALRVQAAELLSNNGGLSAKYANAVTSVHELVSWGMTNAAFQQEVLKKLTQKEVRSNSLTDGLKSFIQRLTFLIFRKDVKASQLTGMGMLINHTAGLLADAAKQHEARESLTLKMQATYDTANQMTPEGIYDALGAAEGTTSAHDTQMRGLLAGIVQSLHGAYGTFHRDLMANQALSSMDVYLKALDTGNRPFASRALASAFVLTKQEAFVLEQVEATVEAAMVSPETLLERTALEKLYREAAAKYNGKPELFHNGDWATAQSHEKDVATEKMNFLFKPETDATTGKSSYLARFAALALASQEVSGLLNFGTARVEEQLSDLKLGARLMELFRRLLTKLGSLHNKTTPGGQANVVLTQLVDRLVDIEAKRRQRIIDGKVSVTDHMEQQLVGLGQGIRNKAVDLSQSTFFKASAQPLIKAAGAAISVVAGDRVGDIMDRFTLIRDAAQNKQQGLIMATISEARGVIESNAGAHAFHDIANINETTRKQEIDYTKTSVKSAFKDAGAYLTEKVQVAMTKVLLRTNASALLVGRTMSELTSMLESPDAQRAERSRLEQALLALPYGRYYIKSVKQLAHHKVVGSSVSKNLMQSTDNIARLYGDTGLAGTVTDAQAAAATALLDPLMALYALDYSSSSDKSAMIQVLRTENARTDKGNGIEFALKLHAGLQAKSKAELFKGKEALLASGFVPEILNSKVEVLFIDRTALAGYEKKGYTLVSNLQQDPSAPVQTDKVMITRLGAGQTGLLSGAVSYTGMQAKGSKVDRKAINPLSDDVPTKKVVLTSIKLARAQAIADMFNAPLSYDPRKDKSGNLVPILNAKGEVVNQRYMMTEHSRDVLLERNDALGQVLGVFAGQIVDKLLSPVQNVNVVRGLRDQYKEDYANRPSSYILVGPDSTDERLKELAKLWPDDMKREVKREWKGDNMYIPADQLNLIMGYRKYSLTEAFSKDEEDGIYGAGANWAERLMVRVAGAILGEKAAWQIGKAEDAAQEVVKLIKDIWVVKNIFTLVGNIMSNVTLLGAQGVPLMQAIRSHAIGIKGILSYRSDNKRLQQLTQALEVGYVPQGTQAVENEIVLLKDRIARNPVKPLIDAGLMPTIVEDVEINDSQYSYSSRLSKAVDSRTKWVPQLAKDAAKQVFATHDTSIYKFLSQTTQMSDFVARYTMYEYLTTRKLDTKSEADALATAKASFVNYDTPTHRWLQYTNDMGITPFTKYYIRIQATIFRLVKERPARVLALALANHYIAGLQSILDSSWINHLGGNPLSVGPFNLPSVLDELPVVNGLLELLPTSN